MRSEYIFRVIRVSPPPGPGSGLVSKIVRFRVRLRRIDHLMIVGSESFIESSVCTLLVNTG